MNYRAEGKDLRGSAEANMKSSDDGLVNRGAVRLMEQPQEEIVSELLHSYMHSLISNDDAGSDIILILIARLKHWLI